MDSRIQGEEFKPNINKTYQTKDGFKTETELWKEWEETAYWIKDSINFKGYCDLRKIFKI